MANQQDLVNANKIELVIRENGMEAWLKVFHSEQKPITIEEIHQYLSDAKNYG